MHSLYYHWGEGEGGGALGPPVPTPLITKNIASTESMSTIRSYIGMQPLSAPPLLIFYYHRKLWIVCVGIGINGVGAAFVLVPLYSNLIRIAE